MTNRCHWCDRRVFSLRSAECRANRDVEETRDHIIPKAVWVRGDDPSTVIACRGCNSARGNAPYEVFRFFVDRFDWRRRPSLQRDFLAFRHDLERAGFRAAIYLAQEAA